MISKNQLKYVHSLEQKKYRRRENAFVAEGPKVVGELLNAHFDPLQLFATKEWAETHQDLVVETVTDDELQRLSFMQHPQQVLAVFRLPEEQEMKPTGLCLALDGVQDPGNMGTIIRIADWFGIQTIYCSEDTVDAWSPKVVQATMGSIARVNIIYISLAALIQQTSVPVYGTLLDGNDLYQETLSREGIIVMGNEGNGISPEIRQLVTHRLLIPKYHEGPESLNVAVATAIVCGEFRRQQRTSCMTTAD